MTGEIGHDARVAGGGKLRINRKELRSSITFFFYCCRFILAQRKLLSGESKMFPVLLLILLSPLYHWSEQCFFSSSPLPRVSRCLMLVPVPPILSHNPFLCSFSFFLLLFSFMAGIDQVTRQQQGSQFYLHFLLSFFHAWQKKGISTLAYCAKRKVFQMYLIF